MLISSFIQWGLGCLSMGYQTVEFGYKVGFITGCVSGGIYYLHTLFKNNGDDILYFNLTTSFIFFKIQNLQLYIIRKYIPLCLPFIIPVGAVVAPFIFIRNIKNNAMKAINVAREFKDRKVNISNFIEEKPEGCPVCLENLNERDNPLSCGHYIHRGCIIRSRKTNCPLCKQELQLTLKEFVRIKYPELI